MTSPSRFLTPGAILDSVNTWLADQVFSGNIFVSDGFGIVVGHSAKITSGGGRVPQFQILGDTSQEDQSMLIAAFGASAGTPGINLARSRGALGTPGTAVNSGDQLGGINVYGDDGTDIQTTSAQITFLSTGTIATNQIPGVIRFRTANTSGTLVESFRVDSTQTLQITGRHQDSQGADVASTNNLVLGIDGNVFEITGTTDINLISNATWQNGSTITLLFTSTATVKDAQTTSGANTTILLGGSADFVPSAGDTIQLTLCEIGGTQAWRETGSRNVL